MTIAEKYTTIQPGYKKEFKGVLFKEQFNPEKYEKVINREFVPSFGVEIETQCLLIDDLIISSLFFSDGSVFDSAQMQFRPNFKWND